MIKLIIIVVLAMVAFHLLRKFSLKNWGDKLDVAITFQQQELVEGESGRLTEVVRNRRRIAFPMVKVAFQTARELVFEKKKGSKTTDLFYHNDIFSLAGGERVTRTLTFVPSVFGYYRINSLEVVAFDAFFTVKEMEERSVDQTLYVYPKPFHTDKFAFYLRQLNGEILTNAKSTEDPFEFRGIREYQPYDDMRSINWKATAKTGDLKVTQKNPTATKEMRILLNLEDNGILRKVEQQQNCVRVAAGLAQHFIKQGMKTAFYANARDIFTEQPPVVSANIGTGHMREICRQLARLDLTETPVDTEECFQEILNDASENMTCFISCNAYDSFTGMLQNYKQQGNEFVWFYVVKANQKVEVPDSLRDVVKVVEA